MKDSSGKEKVLKLLRYALLEKDDECKANAVATSYGFVPLQDEPIMVFAEKFVRGKGKFIYCESERSSFSDSSLTFSKMSPSIVMLIFSFKGFI